MAAPASSAKQAAEDACDTMQACLDTLRDRPDASVPAASKQRLAAAVGLLRTEVAKVGLLYGGGPGSARPSATEQQALLSGLQNGVGGVCMVLMGAAARGGPTLRAALGAAAGKLVAACTELVRGAVGGTAANSEAVMQLAGRCLEQCSTVEKAPLDNRTAVGRAIMQVGARVVWKGAWLPFCFPGATAVVSPCHWPTLHTRSRSSISFRFLVTPPSHPLRANLHRCLPLPCRFHR